VSLGQHGSAAAAVKPDVSRAYRDLAATFPWAERSVTFDGYLDRLWRPTETAAPWGSSRGDGRYWQKLSARGLQALAASAHTRGSSDVGNAAERAARLRRFGLKTISSGGRRRRSPRAPETYQAHLADVGLAERGEAHRILAGRAGDVNLPVDSSLAHRFTGFTGPRQELSHIRRRVCRCDGHAHVRQAVPATAAAQDVVARLAPGA